MKKYLLVLVCLSLSTAYAGSGISYSPSSDECSPAQWSQALSQNGDLTPSLQEWYDGVALEVTDLCVDGNNIRPVKGSAFSVPTADDSGSDMETNRNVNWLKPIKGSESVCVYAQDSDEDCEWQNQYRELSTLYHVPVVNLNSDSRDTVCTKTYQLPACGR